MLAMRNNTSYIKRNLMAEVLRMTFAGTLEKEIDALPPRLYPRDKELVRCCVYKDRAMIRYRLLAMLGFSLEKDDDDTRLLGSFARQALDDAQNRKRSFSTPLTMLETACSSCAGGKYHVTDLCRGCVARPCQINCPKGAITIEKGRSVIDEEKCINCGKCHKLCPYNAIVYTPLPCSQNCPVDAIETQEGGIRSINYEKCISCGNCTRSCPFGAVVERSHIIDIAQGLMAEKPLIALVAPALFGQFPNGGPQLIGALKKIGFSEVVEVALGARETARREAEELSNLSPGEKPLTNSCCPAWKDAVEKHIPSLRDHISHIPSPMALSGDMVKAENKDCITVFIGPCIAKKAEARKVDSIDFTLTFEELGSFLLAKEVEINECTPSESHIPRGADSAEKGGRGFARNGGVALALADYMDREISVEKIDGLDRKKIKELTNFSKTMEGIDFIEVMSCEGGCMGGPGTISSVKSGGVWLEKFIRTAP